jgi:HD-like signal output (HDOD) protein
MFECPFECRGRGAWQAQPVSKDTGAQTQVWSAGADTADMHSPGFAMPAIEHFFKNASALPTMPELATRLLRSLNRDDLSLPELASLLERDQSLAAKVLRLANSARYSRGRSVGSLREAAALIGMRSLRDLSLAACMSGLFPSLQWFDRARFWRHSVATAGHARVMAPLCGADPDVAYLGGLMLRTGRILMLMDDPEAVNRTESMAAGPDSLMAAERAILGCCHPEVSAGLTRLWQFPTELSSAIEAAANPLDFQPFSKLGAVLRMASTLSDAGERELPEVLTLQACHAALILQLDIDLSTLSQLVLPFDAMTVGVDQLLN